MDAAIAFVVSIVAMAYLTAFVLVEVTDTFWDWADQFANRIKRLARTQRARHRGTHRARPQQHIGR